MGLLKALGLGKDPYVEWLVAAYGCEAAPFTVDGFEGREDRWVWEGRAHGVALNVPSQGANKWRGVGRVCLRDPALDAGVAFTDHCIKLWRPGPGERCYAGIDDPFWAEQLRIAPGNPDWPSTMPDEAFELGIALGPYAMHFDCPGDARPLLPHLPGVRDVAGRWSPAVQSLELYPAAIAMNLAAEGLAREALLADVQAGARIVQLIAGLGL